MGASVWRLASSYRALAEEGEVVRSATPVGSAATISHFGPYGDLGAAHVAIQEWCAEHNHRLTGPKWEIYGHWKRYGTTTLRKSAPTSSIRYGNEFSVSSAAAHAGTGCAAGGGVIVPLATLGTATASAHPTFCSDTALSDSTVYDTTQMTGRPVLYDAQPLRYPAKARARGVEGRVLLAVTINADGRPDPQPIQMISSPDSELTNCGGTVAAQCQV